jgi:thiosulfate/3-mercaptopyruvate sulfurtransferase
MPETTLISTGVLADLLGSPSLVVIDCRFDLKETASGERAYDASHIPGAVYAHLDRDLSGKISGSNGRHPLPEPERFAATLARLGVSRDSQIVAYDQDSGMFASRLWWMARWLGHDAVPVLDGGWSKWLAEGRPTSSEPTVAAPGRFSPRLQDGLLVTVDDLSPAAPAGWRLVDARAAERYRGDTEPLDRAAGHIPGAVNRSFQTNLAEDGTFKSPAALADDFRDVIADTPTEDVVCYCGSGVSACHNLLALEHAGLHGAKLYAGSWSEWCADPSRPVATGDSPASRS